MCERACRLWDRHRNTQAFALFHAAALMGDVIGQLSVGYCYAVGKGVPRNLSRAMYWYKRASRRGDSASAHNIGIIYRDKGDFEAARKWLLRAVDKGDPGSAIEVAKLYLARGKRSVGRRYLTYAASNPDWMSEYEFEEAQALLKSLT